MELMRHNDPRLTATTYTDTSLLSLQSAVQKIDFPASQGASQKLVAESQSPSSPAQVCQSQMALKPLKTKVKNRCLARRGVSCPKLKNGARCRA